MVKNRAESTLIADVESRLIAKHADMPPDQVPAVVRGVHARFHESAIRDFVPVLVEKQAGEELMMIKHSAMAS